MARPKPRKSKFGKPPSSSESEESNDTLGSSDSDFVEPRSQRNDFIESSVRTELTKDFVSNDAEFEVILNQLSIEHDVSQRNSNDRLLNVSEVNDNDDNMNIARDDHSGNTVIPNDASSVNEILFYSDGEPVSYHMSESSSSLPSKDSFEAQTMEEEDEFQPNYEASSSDNESNSESLRENQINDSAIGGSITLPNSSFSGNGDEKKSGACIGRNDPLNNVSTSGCTNTCTNSSGSGKGNNLLDQSNDKITSSDKGSNFINSKSAELGKTGHNRHKVSSSGGNNSCPNSSGNVTNINFNKNGTGTKSSGVKPKRRTVQSYKKQMRNEAKHSLADSKNSVVVDLTNPSSGSEGTDQMVSPNDKHSITSKSIPKGNMDAKHSNDANANTTSTLDCSEKEIVISNKANRAKLKLFSGLRPASPSSNPFNFVQTDLCNMFMAINVKVSPTLTRINSKGVQCMKRFDSTCFAELVDQKSNGVYQCDCPVKFKFHVPVTHRLLNYCTDSFISRFRLERNSSGPTQTVINIGYESQLVAYYRSVKRHHERVQSPGLPPSPSQNNSMSKLGLNKFQELSHIDPSTESLNEGAEFEVNDDDNVEKKSDSTENKAKQPNSADNTALEEKGDDAKSLASKGKIPKKNKEAPAPMPSNTTSPDNTTKGTSSSETPASNHKRNDFRQKTKSRNEKDNRQTNHRQSNHRQSNRRQSDLERRRMPPQNHGRNENYGPRRNDNDNYYPHQGYNHRNDEYVNQFHDGQKHWDYQNRENNYQPNWYHTNNRNAPPPWVHQGYNTGNNYRPPPPQWMQGPPDNANCNWDNPYVGSFNVIASNRNDGYRGTPYRDVREEQTSMNDATNGNPNSGKNNAEIKVIESYKESGEKPKSVVVPASATQNDLSIISVSDSVSRNILPSPRRKKEKVVVPICKVLKFKEDNGNIREYHWIEDVFFFNRKEFVNENGVFVELKPDNSMSDKDNNKFFLVKKEQLKKKAKKSKRKRNKSAGKDASPQNIDNESGPSKKGKKNSTNVPLCKANSFGTDGNVFSSGKSQAIFKALLKNKFVETGWKDAIFLYDSSFPNDPFKWNYTAVNYKSDCKKPSISMYGLADVEWLYSNSLRRITLSSEEVLACRSGEIVIRNFLSDEEREEFRRNQVRLSLLRTNVKQLDEAEE